ncbi:hypothetical protein [Marinifilum flexuosum]|uniref:hypothetical protein n=1 Tax=Marinifilum flexuosum TaxID=1117708 RepID=UPI0024920BE8|nr:hypothetical protein [Marinifilum flexuosum]
MQNDKYYIELAEFIHEEVINWDPIGLIKGGAPDDEYDTIEKRFLSGIINSNSEIDILNKVKSNLEYFGLDINELTAKQKNQLELEIKNIIEKLRKRDLELK